MAVLAGRVQRREPRPVLDVDVGPRRAQQRHRLTEPALRHRVLLISLSLTSLSNTHLGGEVERGQAVSLVLVIHGGPGLKQQPRQLQVTSGRGQLQGGPGNRIYNSRYCLEKIFPVHLPPQSRMLGSQPRSMSAATEATCPACAATCSAVWPVWGGGG